MYPLSFIGFSLSAKLCVPGAPLRCLLDMISGRMDRNYHVDIHLPMRGTYFPGHVGRTVCDVLPQSINWDIEGNPNKVFIAHSSCEPVKRDTAATFWTCSDTLRSGTSSKPRVSTRSPTYSLWALGLFDTFGLWSEATVRFSGVF